MKKTSLHLLLTAIAVVAGLNIAQAQQAIQCDESYITVSGGTAAPSAMVITNDYYTGYHGSNYVDFKASTGELYYAIDITTAGHYSFVAWIANAKNSYINLYTTDGTDATPITYNGVTYAKKQYAELSHSGSENTFAAANALECDLSVGTVIIGLYGGEWATFDQIVITAPSTEPVEDVSVLVVTGESANIGTTGTNKSSNANITATSIADPVKAFSHNVLSFNYLMDNADAYCNANLVKDNSITDNANATGIAFWYRTENSNDSVAMWFEIAGSQHALQLSATNGAWRYAYFTTSHAVSASSSDLLFYINGAKDGLYTGTIGSAATIYISEVQATNVTTLPDKTGTVTPTALIQTNTTQPKAQKILTPNGIILQYNNQCYTITGQAINQ